MNSLNLETDKELKKIRFLHDKYGLLCAYFDEDTPFITFSIENGPQRTKVLKGTILGIRVAGEIRTQDFTVLCYSHKLKQPLKFVETGTDRGDTIELIKTMFKEIYSIEIDRERYEKAKERFKNYSHIHIIHGNSSELIPQKADLYWLDAHSAPLVEGNKPTSYQRTGECPLMSELKRIKDFGYILIDDAVNMDGKATFPTLKEIFDFVKKKWGITCQIENGIIIIDKKYG